MAMRTTMHVGKVTGAKHNDRNFVAQSRDGHISPEKTADNLTWTWMDAPGRSQPTFEAAEAAFYEQQFKAGLDARNAAYVRRGHRERVKTLEQYAHAQRTCPTEMLLEIGSRSEQPSAEVCSAITQQYIRWQQKHYPAFKVLDWAVHMDEPGSGVHAHIRGVWIGQDKDGRDIPSMSKALKAMDIPRPDPSKRESRYNCPQMTFTAQCRARFQQICRDHGLDIETKPLPKAKSGRTLSQVKAETARAEEQLRDARQSVAQSRSEMKRLDGLAEQGRQHVRDAVSKAAALGLRADAAQKTIRDAEEASKDAQKARQRADELEGYFRALSGAKDAQSLDIGTELTTAMLRGIDGRARKRRTTVTLSLSDYEQLYDAAQAATTARPLERVLRDIRQETARLVGTEARQRDFQRIVQSEAYKRASEELAEHSLDKAISRAEDLQHDRTHQKTAPARDDFDR